MAKQYTLHRGASQPVMSDYKNKPRIDLNPSSADRWATCTASPQYIFDNWDKLVKQDTFYNQEGTTAHEVAAAFLQNRKPDEKDKKACPVPIDKEMRWHAWNYAEYVNSLRTKNQPAKGYLRMPESNLYVEQKFELFYMQSRNAKVDAVVLNHDEIHVIDFKYGEGLVVSPENNLQAAIYAKCVVNHQFGFLEKEFPIFIHIYQPRGRSSSDSPFHTWETTWGEISEIADKIFKTAQAILLLNKGKNLLGEQELVFAPSEKACQWCQAKGFCEERQKGLTKDIEALAVIDDKPKTLPPANSISIKQLSAVLKHGDNIVKWIKDVKDYALFWMKTGEQIPGFKLVTSRGGNRSWVNPEKAAKLLIKSTMLREDEVYERSVIGPAAVEKLIGKTRFNADLINLIAKPPGQPVIAPVDDKRESCMIEGSSEFSNLDQF